MEEKLNPKFNKKENKDDNEFQNINNNRDYKYGLKFICNQVF